MDLFTPKIIKINIYRNNSVRFKKEEGEVKVEKKKKLRV